jgi:hypothetical protein
MPRSASSQDIQQLEQLKKRFANWRYTRKSKTAIPDRLWNSAVKIAGQCGLCRTAKALRLNYYDLKKRIDAYADASSSSAAFIEWSPSPTGSVQECAIEYEKQNGEKMRIHMKGPNGVDLTALSNAFLRNERRSRLPRK